MRPSSLLLKALLLGAIALPGAAQAQWYDPLQVGAPDPTTGVPAPPPSLSQVGREAQAQTEANRRAAAAELDRGVRGREAAAVQAERSAAAAQSYRPGMAGIDAMLAQARKNAEASGIDLDDDCSEPAGAGVRKAQQTQQMQTAAARFGGGGAFAGQMGSLTPPSECNAPGVKKASGKGGAEETKRLEQRLSNARRTYDRAAGLQDKFPGDPLVRKSAAAAQDELAAAETAYLDHVKTADPAAYQDYMKRTAELSRSMRKFPDIRAVMEPGLQKDQPAPKPSTPALDDYDGPSGTVSVARDPHRPAPIRPAGPAVPEYTGRKGAAPGRILANGNGRADESRELQPGMTDSTPRRDVPDIDDYDGPSGADSAPHTPTTQPAPDPE